jgi:hypothetical protein
MRNVLVITKHFHYIFLCDGVSSVTEINYSALLLVLIMVADEILQPMVKQSLMFSTSIRGI